MVVVLNVKISLIFNVSLNLGVHDVLSSNDLGSNDLGSNDLNGLSLGGNNVDVVGKFDQELDFRVKAERGGVGHLQLGVISNFDLVTLHVKVDNAHFVLLYGVRDSGGPANLLASLFEFLEGLRGGNALDDGLNGAKFKASLDG